MYNRRPLTQDALMAGLLKSVPNTDIPRDRVEVSPGLAGTKQITTELNNNKVVSAPNYSGIPYIWKDGDTYRGILLQYCAVTEDRTFKTAEEAAEWFEEMYHETDG